MKSCLINWLYLKQGCDHSLKIKSKLFIIKACTVVFGFSIVIAFNVQAASFKGLEFISDEYTSCTNPHISGDGLVVGGSCSHPRNHNAFRWTESEGMHKMGGVPDTSIVTALSYDGSTVVGRFSSNSQAFRWTTSSGFEWLGTFSDPNITNFSIALDISDDARLIAGASNFRAFYWTEAGGMRGLNSNGISGIQASTVSGDGSVIIGLGHSSSTGGEVIFRFASPNGLDEISDLSSTGISVSSTSYDGSLIVGTLPSVIVDEFGGNREAYRWTEAGGIERLGDLPGGPFISTATDVSADGSIVVGSGSNHNSRAAIIWDPVNGLKTLRDKLINEYGLCRELEGWHLLGATGISNDGKTVVGNGIDPEGRLSVWIANLSGSLSNNSCPIANAGNDQLVAVGDLVALDGNGSTDLDGDFPLSYSWKFAAYDKPAGSTATLVDPSTANPGFIPDLVGEYIVQLIVTDAMGLSSALDTVTITVDAVENIDTIPPTIIPPADQVVEAISSTAAIVSYPPATATDNVGVVNGPDCIPASGSTFKVGDTVVTCTASDAAGNTGLVTFTVTLQDTMAPMLTAPVDQLVEATSSAGAIVTYPPATATDTIGVISGPDCVPATGSSFALGNTLVMCTAMDAAGNTGLGSFTVTVQDTIAPLFIPLANQIVEATSPIGVIVSYPPVIAIDNVGIVRGPICSHASGSRFALGETIVTCTASDAAGNSSLVAFTITVEDTAAPVMTTPENIVAEADSPTATVVTYQTITATDNVGVVTGPSCSQASGSLFELGVTRVQCTAMDAAGNTAQASFTVTVQDTTAPEVKIGLVTDGVGSSITDNDASFSDTVNINFSGSDSVGVDRFECSLDGAAFSLCSSPSGYTDLLAVTHTYVIRAYDLAGNFSEATFSWTVQTFSYGIKNVIADIQAIINTKPGRRQEKRLKQAIKKLNQALSALVLIPADLSRAVDKIDLAGSKIEKGIRAGLNPSDANAILKKLANIARYITEEVIAAGSKTKKIARAQALLSKAIELQNQGKYQAAIKKYRRAANLVG